MMMFAVLFGRSIDYEVFLLSRLREGYRRGGNNVESVLNPGSLRPPRVISSSELIIIAVYPSFVT